MAAVVSFEPSRWTSSHYHQPTIPNPSVESFHAAAMAYNQHKLPSLTDPNTDTSTYRSRLHERSTPPSPQPPVHHQASDVSSWPRTLGNERHASAPLTLQIPNDQELPRISTMFNPPSAGHYHHDNKTPNRQPPPQSTTTMLPPFASFQDHAKRADGLSDQQRTSPSAHAQCNLCSKLQPMVVDVATAVADLDESIQLLCNRPWARSSEYPRDPFQAVQWIMDRLRCGKLDIQAAIRNAHPSSASQPTPTSGMASRNISPSLPLKRAAEFMDREDSPVHKRLNTGRPFEEPYNVNAIPSHDRAAPLSFNAKSHTRPTGVTPPPMDVLPASAHSKIPSPGHAMRSLPSPSSVAYPPSAAPSLAPHNAHSPSMSQAADASIHPGSADAATSAHIADLQHQVTLKSLALQTLQSEYSSVLQRVQRLNVKTQTLERKSSVADHEVNELTNKNEDLAQQLQSLQEQLDDSESRREKEREDSTREKDQWLQMLEQGRRLQAKVSQEKAALTQRISALQAENDKVRSDAPGSGADLGDADSVHNATAITTTAELEDAASLKADIEMLRSSLEEARTHRQLLDERAHEVLRRSTDIGILIDRALTMQRPFDEARILSAAVRKTSSTDDNAHSRSLQHQPRISPPQVALESADESNVGSFRPLTTHDAATLDANALRDPPKMMAQADAPIEATTTPSLSLEVANSASSIQSLLTTPNGLLTPITPITPLSSKDAHGNHDPAATPFSKQSAFEHGAASTTMPPPPRPTL